MLNEKVAYTESELAPAKWKEDFLDNVAVRKSGHTPDKKESKYWGGDIPWISLKDLQRLNKGYIFETTDYTTIEGIRNSSAVVLPAGTIVISRDASVGKVGILSKEMATSQHFINYICGEKLNNIYLYYYLLFNSQIFERIATGSTIKTIGLDFFKKLRILLPTVEEQYKIATILSTWDRAIELKEKLIEQKKEQKKGLMQKLLTEKGRLPGFEGEWKEDKLKRLCNKIMDGTHNTPKYVDSGIPFYSVENVTRRDFKNNKYITQEEHKAISSRCKVERNDILITRIGSIGDAVLVDWDHESSIYVSLALLKTKDKIMPEFLVQYMGTDKFKRDILSKSLTTAIPQKINLGDLGEVNISYPSDIREQNAIVEILSKADEEIYLLERDLKETRNQKKGLMQILLTGKIRVRV